MIYPTLTQNPLTLFKRTFHKPERIVLDIGSSSVYGARVGFDEKGLLEVKKVGHSPTLILPEVDIKKLWKKIRRRVEDMIHDLTQDAKDEYPNDIVVVFSSPWYFSEISHFSLTKKESFEINKDFLNTFLLEEKKKFKQASLARFHMREDEIQVLDAEIMEIKLNGYPVKNSVGKRARTFEAFVGLSAVFKKASADIKAMAEDYAFKRTHFYVSPFIFYNVLRQIEGWEEVLIVDIGGEVTDISLIQHGLLIDTSSYGRGFNYAVRRLADTLNIDLDNASDLITNYESKKLDASKAQSVKKALENLLTDWQNLFEEALTHLSIKGLLPEKLLLLGQGAALEEFKQAVSNKSFSRYTLFRRPFSVHSSMPEDLKNRFKHLPGRLARIPSPLSFYLAYGL